MKHTTTTVIISAVLAGSLAAAAPAFARGMGPHGDCGHDKGMVGMHGDPEARLEQMTLRLNLDAKQRDAVRAIADKHRDEMRALRDRMTDNHKQLRALTAAQGDVDEAKLRAVADAQGKDMADMIMMRARMQAEIGKVLTPAQREQMQKQRRGGFDPQEG